MQQQRWHRPDVRCVPISSLDFRTWKERWKKGKIKWKREKMNHNEIEYQFFVRDKYWREREKEKNASVNAMYSVKCVPYVDLKCDNGNAETIHVRFLSWLIIYRHVDRFVSLFASHFVSFIFCCRFSLHSFIESSKMLFGWAPASTCISRNSEATIALFDIFCFCCVSVFTILMIHHIIESWRVHCQVSIMCLYASNPMHFTDCIVLPIDYGNTIPIKLW